ATMKQDWSLPVVAETWDGFLNDINGFHVKPEDVFAALDSAHGGPVDEGDVGSIIIVVATEAPLLPHQLKRIARRATMGLARTGSTSGNGSGDIFIAFSTANPHAVPERGPNNVPT